LMATAFLSAIALCVFLKDAQNKNFMYAQSSNHTKIRAAHFSFLDTQSHQDLIEYLPTVDAEIISLQIPTHTHYEDQLLATLNPRYKYQKSIQCNNNFGVLLFSTMPIDNLDTLEEGKAICLSASIWVDSSDKKLNLVSMYLPQQDYSQQHYEQLGHQVKHCTAERPTLTFSNIQERAWSTKMQSFKTSAAVNDSRMDIEWNPSQGAIFYSDALRCLGFKKIFGGKGVLGEYEFKSAEAPSSTQESYSERDAYKQALTMF